MFLSLFMQHKIAYFQKICQNLKSELDQVYIFQCIYFKSFQIHQQVKMYHYECANHDTHLDFLF